MKKNEQKNLLDVVLGNLQDDGLDNTLEQIVIDAFSDIIQCIKNDHVKRFVSSILFRTYLYKSVAGSAFWESPSSFIPGDHPPDEYDNDGMVIHTRRVAKFAMAMGSSIGLPDDEMDALLAAALLHDITKAVYCDEELNVTHDPLHLYTIDSFISFMRTDDTRKSHDAKSNTLDIPYEQIINIIRLIHCSHGVWSPIPETLPMNELEKVLAMANYTAENLHVLVPDLFADYQVSTDE